MSWTVCHWLFFIFLLDISANITNESEFVVTCYLKRKEKRSTRLVRVTRNVTFENSYARAMHLKILWCALPTSWQRQSAKFHWYSNLIHYYHVTDLVIQVLFFKTGSAILTTSNDAHSLRQGIVLPRDGTTHNNQGQT